MIIGLTGNIATGKTTVAAMLQELGAHVLDADAVSRDCMQKDGPSYPAVICAFGKEILQEDGSIDRKKLGQVVFYDPEQRKKLEALTHPCIVRRMMEAARRTPSEQVLVLEATLLMETDLLSCVDTLWMTHASPKTQLHRLMKRNQLSKEEAGQRIRSQRDISEKSKMADVLIDTEGSLDCLQQRVGRLYEQICAK